MQVTLRATTTTVQILVLLHACLLYSPQHQLLPISDAFVIDTPLAFGKKLSWATGAGQHNKIDHGKTTAQVTPFGAAAPLLQQQQQQQQQQQRRHAHTARGSRTARHVIPAGAASIIAGSLAGAIGVGVAFPFDTVKTKAQVWSSSQSTAAAVMALPMAVAATSTKKQDQEEETVVVLDYYGSPMSNATFMASYYEPHMQEEKELVLVQSTSSTYANSLRRANDDDFSASIEDTSSSWSMSSSASDGSAVIVDMQKTGGRTLDLEATPLEVTQERQRAVQLNMFQIMERIWREDGIAGFFGGVRVMMIGQGIIKAMSFTVNGLTLQHLQTMQGTLGEPPTATTLLGAAFCAGLCASFLVSPVERIKVMLQSGGQYENEVECLKAILDSEGVKGLMQRGLLPTMAREIPSDAIYFSVYGLLMQTALAGQLDWGAPLVFGAMAGCASWIPVYPIDVVKTIVQNCDGIAAAPGAESNETTSRSSLQVAADLYQQGGIAAFYEGLTPKLLRACVFHSVTFFVYDQVLRFLMAHTS